MQQNCKKGLCLAFLFSAMFLTGWEIAGMRSRQTKETAAVAYEAGNWGSALARREPSPPAMQPLRSWRSTMHTMSGIRPGRCSI